MFWLSSASGFWVSAAVWSEFWLRWSKATDLLARPSILYMLRELKSLWEPIFAWLVDYAKLASLFCVYWITLCTFIGSTRREFSSKTELLILSSCFDFLQTSRFFIFSLLRRSNSIWVLLKSIPMFPVVCLKSSWFLAVRKPERYLPSSSWWNSALSSLFKCEALIYSI